jgi:hypothetical protein
MSPRTKALVRQKKEATLMGDLWESRDLLMLFDPRAHAWIARVCKRCPDGIAYKATHNPNKQGIPSGHLVELILLQLILTR